MLRDQITTIVDRYVDADFPSVRIALIDELAALIEQLSTSDVFSSPELRMSACPEPEISSSQVVKAPEEAEYVRRLENAFLMAYDLAGIDATPLPEALPESAYIEGYMSKVRELREVFALASKAAAIALANEQKDTN